MANTLKFGNGNWATKDGSTLAYNDESGFNPLPFDFTRASSATVVNKNGLIETVASGIPRIDFLGNTKGALLLEPSRTNLIAQSQAFDNSYWTKSGASIQGDASTAGAEQVVNGNFATDSDWTKATGVTISGGTLNFSGVANGDSGTNQSSSIVVGKTYKATFTVSNWVAGGVRILLGSTGTSATRSSNGTFTAYVVASGNTTIYLQSIGVTTLSIDNVSIKEVQGFSSPSADSPLGAFKLVEDTGTSAHKINSSIATTLAGVNSISIYIKKGELKNIGLKESQETGKYASFDLVNLTVLDKSSGVEANINSQINGWIKVSMQVAITGTSIRFSTHLLSSSYTSGDPNTSYTGDGTTGVYIYGAQLEVGSYSTSLINTSGSAVTRQADVCTNGANSEVINSTEGVLMVEIAALADDNSDRKISLSDGSLNNVINIGLSRFSGNINAEVKSGGVLQTAGFGATGVTQTNSNKFALSWGGGTTKFYVNGILASSHTSVTSPIGMNVLDFSLSSGFEKMYANVKDIRVYTTALTDSELAALTTI